MGVIGCAFRLLIAVSCAMALQGCATYGAAGGGEAQVAPLSLLPAHRANGDGMIRFTRVSRIAGVLCAVTVKLDGDPVARVGSGEFVLIGAERGERRLTAHFAETGPCPSQVSTITVPVVAGKTAHAVFDINQHGQQLLQLQD